MQNLHRHLAMLARVPSALRQFAPRGARLLAQQADAVTPYRELASTTAAQREVSAGFLCVCVCALQQIGMLCLNSQKKERSPACPPLSSLSQAWATQDELMHARMKEHVPAALEHNGEESFANHLVGVQSVLRSWNASETLCNAARSRWPCSLPQPVRSPTAPEALPLAQGEPLWAQEELPLTAWMPATLSGACLRSPIPPPLVHQATRPSSTPSMALRASRATSCRYLTARRSPSCAPLDTTHARCHPRWIPPPLHATPARYHPGMLS